MGCRWGVQLSASELSPSASEADSDYSDGGNTKPRQKQQKRTPTADGAAVVAQCATRASMRRRCSAHCEAEGEGDGDAEAQESAGGGWKRQQEGRLVSPNVLGVLCEYCEYCKYVP